MNNDWSTNDTPASPPFHEKISYQDTHIISKSDEVPDLNHCILEPKMEDRDERVISQDVPKSSDIDHRNLISLTHSPHMNSPMSVDVDYRAFPGIPMPPSPPVLLIETIKDPKDNIESVDMDLSDDDEKPKSNRDQKHSVLLPPPPPPPLPFEFDQPNVSDVTNKWDQSSQQWNNKKMGFIENQWNVEQPEQWKQPNQWKPEQSDLNFIHNQLPHQWPQHNPRQPKEDYRPKWNRGTNMNWPRGPRNFNPRSRPSGRWNQGPRFGPRHQPW